MREVNQLPSNGSLTVEAADTRGINSDTPEHSADIRQGRELLQATRPFAQEAVSRSWWYVITTFALMIAALAGAGLADRWPIRAALSLLGALLMVRAFITYHDFMHGAILRGSRLALWLFNAYGALALTPASSWKETHNYHHGHVGQISFTSVGAFPFITTRKWKAASRVQRLRYRALQSSGYMRMNRIMQWFTGNIGYHHIHHLNVRIPFYRLPEAMAAIPEVQTPLTTALTPREIVSCFRSSLWDEERHRMVSYSEAG